MCKGRLYYTSISKYIYLTIVVLMNSNLLLINLFVNSTVIKKTAEIFDILPHEFKLTIVAYCKIFNQNCDHKFRLRHRHRN